MPRASMGHGGRRRRQASGGDPGARLAVAQRAGISSPHVPYGWARDVWTWPATLAARDAVVGSGCAV